MQKFYKRFKWSLKSRFNLVKLNILKAFTWLNFILTIIKYSIWLYVKRAFTCKTFITILIWRFWACFTILMARNIVIIIQIIINNICIRWTFIRILTIAFRLKWKICYTFTTSFYIQFVNETFFTFDPLSNILNGCLIKFLSLSFPGKLTRCFTLCILRLRFDQFSPLCRNIISLWIFFWRFILYLAQLWTYFCNFYAIGLKYIIVKGQKLKE